MFRGPNHGCIPNPARRQNLLVDGHGGCLHPSCIGLEHVWLIAVAGSGNARSAPLGRMIWLVLDFLADWLLWYSNIFFE